MSTGRKNSQIIAELARRVAEIAGLEVHNEKRDMWVRLNRLERVRPLIHVQAIAQSIWAEFIPTEQLETSGEFCRAQELALRKTIYCWENFPDDRVVEDVIVCPIAIRGDAIGTSFGIPIRMDRPEMEFGAGIFRPAIESESDIDKIETEPRVWVDWDATERNYERLCDLYDGMLRVEKRGPDFFWLQVVDQFIRWRSVEQTFVDLVERPKWVHEALERITRGHLSSIEQLEKLGVLSPGNGNTRLGSGGYGWTDQLPQPDFDGTHVRLKDLWARCATQIFTDGISPEMHDEFAIQYEKRLLERFGLGTYGCCEPLHKKMRYVRRIRNLRRVSMSPWVDIEMASSEVGRDYVYTHKPNPAIVSMVRWHPELAREQLSNALEKTRDNVVEVNLQDLHTVRNEPHRLTEWTQMALGLAEEYA